ncbi:MAG TPA: peptidoglycan-binding domain-containing protein [Candidatus Paceibacterota bacterium]|nr:peptidoglycan-binding domain-containing protein [Candidatus Paceibacterota bacterium]
MKTLSYEQLRVSAFAAAFVLLASVAFPAFTHADDAPPAPDTTIATGDAAAESGSQNDVNTNVTSTDGDATVSADNAATTTSDTSATADTGDNAASGGSGDAFIGTGNAYASANALNVINTNIVDSAGLIRFSDLFGALGIDLRGLDLSYFDTGTQTSTCSFGGCAGGDLTVNTANAATTTNSVAVIARTGSNAASSTDGSAKIETGDAYASGNAVNLVNSNVIRSNYLLVGINDFGNLGGDIVLPGADFFEHLLSRSRDARDTQVTTDNTAVVTDSTSAVADTGNNAASSTGGDASVTTGNALSSATSLNQVNTNVVGGSKVFFLFRIWGNWSGTVQGLPDGMRWEQTPAGVVLQNADGAPAGLDDLATGGSVTANATNTADVTNDVSVYALTGQNQAESGTSTIATGDAYAAANSVNIVNTNLIGTNWIYAIFNIFGNFSGDISFGHPDLWLGASAEAGNPTLPDSPVTLRFTVSNQGDADATNVKLSTSFLRDMLHFHDASETGDGDAWNLGTIAKGQTKEFTYDAQAGEVPRGNSIAVPLAATVTSDQTDNNDADNTDNLTIVVTNPGSPESGDGPSFSSDPKLSITKDADATATTAPATIDYSVDIRNDGGPAFDAVATDVLTGPDGSVVNTQSWPLDTINFQDDIRITYSAVFDADLAPGTYTNTVTVTGWMHYPDGPGSVEFSPVSATKQVSLLAGRVLGASVAPECEQYLTAYLAPGVKGNDPAQVKLLQEFLIKYEAENGVTVNGKFDAATEAAVKRFQEKYADKILAPWGYDAPTGLVYYTTREQINDVYCSGTRSFALSDTEQNEVATTRALLATLRNGATHPAIPHTLDLPATSTPDFALPPGVQVGGAPTGDGEAQAPEPPSGWLGRLFDGGKQMVSDVLGVFSSVVDTVALR